MNYTNFNYNINYYANIKDNKIIGSGARLLNEDILNIPITAEIAKNIQNYKFVAPDKIIPKTEDEIQVEKAKEERERLNNLTMTKRVLWLQLKELGITYQQLKDLIATNEDAQAEWDLCENLKRDNPLLDIMGAKLNVTPEQIDNMFKIANGEIRVKEENKELEAEETEPVAEDAEDEN